jgi:hypothetical protein
MTLSNEERRKFAAYLEQLAVNSTLLLKQATTVSAPRALTDKLRMETGAALVIADLLNSTESVEITPEESSTAEKKPGSMPSDWKPGRCV